MKRLWDDRRVVVSVGTGGVGKTTVSASLAIAAAAAGKRTLVMTIDPARRLANALGIDGMGNVEYELTSELLAGYGIEVQAPVWAMMPDVKSTFDKLVERFSPDPGRRDAILRNQIYQHFSTALAGAQEYAAVEKLYEVYSSERYDLIVLDTPPSQNALDFFNAPSRILDFLEQDSLQWLSKPYSSSAGRFSLKLFDLGTSFISKTLGRLAGAATLKELGEFIAGFQGMYDGFRERAAAVKRLLGSDEVAFVMVGAASLAQRQAMKKFRDELRREGLAVRGVVLNRVVGELDLDPSAVEAQDFPVSLRAAALEELTLAERDATAIRELGREVGEVPILTLPELRDDVHDLAGLAQLYPHFLKSD